MLQIDILTLFPDFFKSPFQSSILKIAREKNLLSVATHNIRDYSTNKHNKVDDYPYGGEGGMVMMPQPLADSIENLAEKNENYDEIIFFTPDGVPLKQETLNLFSLKKKLLLLCGHYKGIDERIRKKYITKEISIGDFVVTGGEIPALIFVDGVSRLIAGVLGDETSALNDSFQNHLLSYPVYTRPEHFKGMKVPSILLSGNHKLIEDWKQEQALKRTTERRPDLLENGWKASNE